MRQKYAHMLAQTDGHHNITFDKSPSYADLHFFPNTSATIRAMFPSAKAIAVVCDPVERAWSQFHHYKRLGNLKNITMFDEAVYALQHNSTFCKMIRGARCQKIMDEYFVKGHYADHIRDWQRDFGAENAMVVALDDLSGDKRERIIREMLRFVGLKEELYDWEVEKRERGRHRYKNNDPNYKREVPPHLGEVVGRYFLEKNEELAELLGDEAPRQWNKKYYSRLPSSSSGEDDDLGSSISLYSKNSDSSNDDSGNTSAERSRSRSDNLRDEGDVGYVPEITYMPTVSPVVSSVARRSQ